MAKDRRRSRRSRGEVRHRVTLTSASRPSGHAGAVKGPSSETTKPPLYRRFLEADEGTRTLDLRLGKPTLYQLSYAREAHRLAVSRSSARSSCPLMPQTSS